MTTSRERVLDAVNHREPDRVPIDLSGHRSSGVMAIAYNKLKQHLGITSGDIYVYDFVQQLAIVEPEVLDRFGVDTVELGRGFALTPEDWRDWVLPDGTPCKIPAFIHPVKEHGDWCIYAPDGTLLDEWHTIGDVTFQKPVGVFVDDNTARLFIADVGAGKVYVFQIAF